MKHAFLIMAHDNFPLLKRLIMRLDCEFSNIYIHIDKKALFSKKNEDEIRTAVKEAKIVFIPRSKVTWGGV